MRPRWFAGTPGQPALAGTMFVGVRWQHCLLERLRDALCFVLEDAEEYESRRFYKDDPNYAANPRRMPRTVVSHLPSATAAVVAPPPRTVYMDAGTMEMIPQARMLQSYDDLLDDRDQLVRAMEQVARDTEPDWPINEQALMQRLPKERR